jgi:hypothetical protein
VRLDEKGFTVMSLRRVFSFLAAVALLGALVPGAASAIPGLGEVYFSSPVQLTEGGWHYGDEIYVSSSVYDSDTCVDVFLDPSGNNYNVTPNLSSVRIGPGGGPVFAGTIRASSNAAWHYLVQLRWRRC